MTITDESTVVMVISDVSIMDMGICGSNSVVVICMFVLVAGQVTMVSIVPIEAITVSVGILVSIAAAFITVTGLWSIAHRTTYWIAGASVYGGCYGIT